MLMDPQSHKVTFSVDATSPKLLLSFVSPDFSKTTQTFPAPYFADLSFPWAFWLNLCLPDASRLC